MNVPTRSDKLIHHCQLSGREMGTIWYGVVWYCMVAKKKKSNAGGNNTGFHLLPDGRWQINGFSMQSQITMQLPQSSPISVGRVN